MKTGKDGRYSQWGLRPGVYKISLVDPKNASFAYSEAHTLHGAAENDVSINFGSSSQSPSAVAHTPDEEDAKQFAIVKSHFNAGAGAMYDAQTLRAQLAPRVQITSPRSKPNSPPITGAPWGNSSRPSKSIPASTQQRKP